MKHTERHQCKCHLKSESAFINSTATKCSAVSYISSCSVCMTENVLIAILCRDLLINRSWLVTWQSVKHTALLATGKPQDTTWHSKRCPLITFLSPRVCIYTIMLHDARHGQRLHSYVANARLTCFIAVLALWFQEQVFSCFQSPVLLGGYWWWDIRRWWTGTVWAAGQLPRVRQAAFCRSGSLAEGCNCVFSRSLSREVSKCHDLL